MTDFSSLSLSPALLRAVEVLGFEKLTPVQEHALPHILAGNDVIAQARTGSGKTAAYGLGLLARLDATTPAIQALVLCPTRELAEQVSADLRRLARFIPNVKVVTLCGGVPVRTQTPSLEHSPHIIVGTPGRILDHLRRETLSFKALRVLVIDEADRMLDMGFVEAIQELVEQVPKKRQTLLFSATYPDEVRAMSKQVQPRAVDVTVDVEHAEHDIEQIFFEVEPAQKLDALAALLAQHRPETALVFCHTRDDVRMVHSKLVERGYSALALHGELEQWERDDVLRRFANKSATILVATDVAARGLDIKDLPAVIAWELPEDADTHVHRSGRTGRAGKTGLALNLVSPRERRRAKAIEEQLGRSLRWESVDVRAGANATPLVAPMVTLLIDGGKQDKLRPGDLLGALTGDVGLPGSDIGKIDVQPKRTTVAVRREVAERAAAALSAGKIKGRAFRVRVLG